MSTNLNTTHATTGSANQMQGTTIQPSLQHTSGVVQGTKDASGEWKSQPTGTTGPITSNIAGNVQHHQRKVSSLVGQDGMNDLNRDLARTDLNDTNRSSIDRSSIVHHAGDNVQRPNLVHSNVASSSSAGQGSQGSNIDQVMQGLDTAHNAHSAWIESESVKIHEWGKGEIARILQQTKTQEERLVADAQLKQKQLEDSHRRELERSVQALDLKKSQELKQLEAELQSNIQGSLDRSKKEIQNIEGQMHDRKLALLKQSQLETSKEVDRLASLQVQAKLVPTQTRTVIETNTEPITVRAVAGGGEFVEKQRDTLPQRDTLREKQWDGQASFKNSQQPIQPSVQHQQTQQSGLLPTHAARNVVNNESRQLGERTIPGQEGEKQWQGTDRTRPIEQGQKQWSTPGDAGLVAGQQQPIRGGDSAVERALNAPFNANAPHNDAPIPLPTTADVVAPSTASVGTARPVDSSLNNASKPRVDAAYGRDLEPKRDLHNVKHDANMSTTDKDRSSNLPKDQRPAGSEIVREQLIHTDRKADDRTDNKTAGQMFHTTSNTGYNKDNTNLHNTSGTHSNIDSSTGKPQSEGFFGKIKHAITGEPKTSTTTNTDGTTTRV